VDFLTKKGESIRSFTYPPSLSEDFYDSTVTVGLGAGVIVETWGSGAGGLMEPICGDLPSLSNLNVLMPMGETYKYTKDHSKYALSMD
jgi:deoxyribonuclease-2